MDEILSFIIPCIKNIVEYNYVFTIASYCCPQIEQIKLWIFMNLWHYANRSLLCYCYGLMTPNQKYEPIHTAPNSP